jgi:hypothetical protein
MGTVCMLQHAYGDVIWCCSMQDADGCRAIAESIKLGYAPSFGTGLQAAQEFLCTAFQSSPTPPMQAAAVAFLSAEVAQLDAEDAQIADADPSSSKSKYDVLLRGVDALAQQQIEWAPSDEVLVHHVGSLLRQGRPADAQARLDAALTEQPSSWHLLGLALRLHAARGALRGSAVSSSGAGNQRSMESPASELVARCLAAVAGTDALHLLTPAASLLLAQALPLDAVIDKAEELLRTSARDGGGVLAEAVAAIYRAIWCVHVKMSCYLSVANPCSRAGTASGSALLVSLETRWAMRRWR